MEDVLAMAYDDDALVERKRHPMFDVASAARIVATGRLCERDDAI